MGLAVEYDPRGRICDRAADGSATASGARASVGPSPWPIRGVDRGGSAKMCLAVEEGQKYMSIVAKAGQGSDVPQFTRRLCC
ncbi:hypothetical protein GCM10017562_72760 [Streptomyces roseofulvus]